LPEDLAAVDQSGEIDASARVIGLSGHLESDEIAVDDAVESAGPGD